MKIKIYDEVGRSIFKSKGKKDKVQEELEEFFKFKG